MPSLFMDEKIYFIRLAPNTLQIFGMSLCCYGMLVHVSRFPTLKVLPSKVNGP
jgi:hypothetical protein